MNVTTMDSTGNLDTDGYGNSLTSMVQGEHDEDNGIDGNYYASSSLRDLDAAENAVLLDLFFLCERASAEDSESWDDVKQWLREHSIAEAREAAMMTGDDNTTALYLACRNRAPIDIVEALIGVAPQATRMANNLGWLPMHIACHFDASLDVLRILADANPESMKSMDKRGRTPLHFALGNVKKPVTPAAVLLLLSNDAGRCADMGGMLPLHYACAYGATEAVLNVLLEGNHDTIIARDNKGRTPLHYAMGNCTRDASPAIVRTLLLNNPTVVNMVESEGGFLPLHMLATAAEKLTLEQDGPAARTNAQACLDHYINANPDTTTEFFTTFQKLPNWLIDYAVQSPIVQMILNRKIAQRFPIFIQMADLYSLIFIIVCYNLSVIKSLELREQNSRSDISVEFKYVFGLFIGGLWFATREFLQILSYIDLGIFHDWLADGMNYIDVSQITVAFTIATVTFFGKIEDDYIFRLIAAILLPMPIIKTILFLRSINVEFSVFYSGMINVLFNLKIFLLTIMIVLIMFTTIFNALVYPSKYCELNPDFPNPEFALCERNFIGLWHSFLFILTMLLGEVQIEPFLGTHVSKMAIIFFALFMVLVVVLLANVLIAVVTDSYSWVRNERASIVFWKDRLDFIAEMDALTNFIFKYIKKFKKDDSAQYSNSVVQRADDSIAGNSIPNTRNKDDSKYYDQNTWDGLLEIFEQSNLNFFSWDFFLMTILRLCALIIIPIIIFLGFFSFGMLWPEQVRRRILSRISDKDAAGNQKDERLSELKAMHKGLKQWQDSVEIEMASDRKNVTMIKNSVMEHQTDVMRQMKEIKQIMTMLFELQGALELD